MTATNSVLIVPVLSVVVLGALLISLSRSLRSIGVGAAGVLGVVVGGPLAILLLGPGSAAVTADDALSADIVVEKAETESGDASVNVSQVEAAPDAVADLPDQPQRGIVYPDDWPDWINSPPSELDGWESVLVDSGPHERRGDAQDKFSDAVEEATRQFINEYLDSSYAATLLRYDLKTTGQGFLNESYVYEGTIDSPSVGPMHVKYALIAFDQSFRDELSSKWETVLARCRLLQTALIGGAVLALLGVLFCYLRLDHATRGFYTGRLQFVALTAILVLIATGVVVARWIPWI